jgi:hypothetical protein
MQSKVERQGEAIKGKEKKKIKKQKDVGIQVCMKRNGDDTNVVVYLEAKEHYETINAIFQRYLSEIVLFYWLQTKLVVSNLEVMYVHMLM